MRTLTIVTPRISLDKMRYYQMIFAQAGIAVSFKIK